MRNVFVIAAKQIKDTIKNNTVLIQFVMFPVLTLIMENAVNIKGMPDHFFVKLFSIMYMGMAPLTSVAAIISEEKEKNTLRVLLMANVKPWEYLTGVGLYVWSVCMLGSGVMAAGLPLSEIPFYLAVMAAGFVISIAIGACIGVFAKDQMMATSIVMPVMMVFSFAPMLAMFNDTIKEIARIFYTQQMRILMNTMTIEGISREAVLTIGINAVLAVVLFFVAIKRKGLE